MQHKLELEDKLRVKISVKGTETTIKGKELDEYFATRVLEALDYKFFIEDALLLKTEAYLFEVLDIKSYTMRTDISVIKGRIIGRGGKTLKVLSDLTGCALAMKGNSIAIIGKAEEIEHASEAIITLIKGRKQGNVYAHLERSNKRKRLDD